MYPTRVLQTTASKETSGVRVQASVGVLWHRSSQPRFISERRHERVTMNGRILSIAMLLLFVAGCESYTWVVYNNAAVPDMKEGRDCRVHVFGLGGAVDETGIKAMRLGAITRVRSTEYRVNTIQGVGNECVIAHGE